MELVDEGFITQKDNFPIRELHFGDTGGERQYAYATLGPLACKSGNDLLLITPPR